MENYRAVLDFARELYGRKMVADVKGGRDDWFDYRTGNDGTLHVEAGSPRGVLYAVYEALEGKLFGSHRPEFSIRGINPCESLNRHTTGQLKAMGRWRMNTLPSTIFSMMLAVYLDSVPVGLSKDSRLPAEFDITPRAGCVCSPRPGRREGETEVASGFPLLN